MDEDVKLRIEKLEELAQMVNMPDFDPNRGMDVEIALTARPDLFFETAPSRGYMVNRIGMHGAIAPMIPDGNEPHRFVPLFTTSWDATKKLMLPNWCIDSFNEWFDRGCGVKLVEGRLFSPTNRWFHTAEQHTVEQQGPNDICVLLAATLLSYAVCLKAGTISFEPRMLPPLTDPPPLVREPPAELYGDMG